MHPLGKWFDKLFWYILYRLPGHRYNMVPTGLPPAYYDIDVRMLHSCFNLLVQYVEIELPALGRANSNGNIFATDYEWACHYIHEVARDVRTPCREAQLEFLTEVSKLYHWWVLERPQRPEPFGDDSLTTAEQMEMEARQDQEDDEQLIRLMRIRRSLWT